MSTKSIDQIIEAAILQLLSPGEEARPLNPPLVRVDRVAALGDSVVPPCAEVVGRLIQHIRRNRE